MLMLSPAQDADPVQKATLAGSRRGLWQRQFEIFWVVSQFGFFLWWDRWFPNRTQDHQIQRSQWLTQQLIRLGPTFIKIGQALSTRPDLLPLHYVQALGKLQDNVPEFPGSEAIALIESELGKSLHDLYQDFDHFPLAAASLGQVHKAILPTGEIVVVKVQRPGLQQLFDLDLQVLKTLTDLCTRLLPWTRTYQLDAIHDEFFNFLYREIDYVQEGKNADQFRKNFSSDPRVIAPKIYWRYTSRRILTMDYLPGIKVNDRESLQALGVDLKALNHLGIYCYLKQLLVDGFFQADPHPGNMAVTPEGKLIFYDFGMMGEIKTNDREKMIKTFFAVIKRDATVLIDNLVDLGLLERVSDMAPIQRMTSFVLEQFADKPIDIRVFKEMKGELYAMFEQQPFRLPPQMTFIIKSLTTLDGIARVLDPDYSLMVAAQPFVKTMVTSQGRLRVVGELARQTRDLVQQKLKQPNPTILTLRRLEERLERGDLQLKVRSQEQERILRQISMALKSLIYMCWTGFSLVAGSVLLWANYFPLAIAALILSGLGFLVLVRSLIVLTVRERLDRFIDS